MSAVKINDRILLRLIDKDNKSQSEAAQMLGVSRQAVSQRLRELRGRTTRVVVTRKVEDAVDGKLNAIEQLNKINGYANELLDLLMRWGRGDKEALQILESQVTTRKVRVGNEEIDVQEFKLKDPRELALKAMAEIRGQLKLQLEIFETLYSLQAAEEFQNAVMEAIGEASPDVRTRIIQKLNQRSTVRGALKFH